MPAAQIKTLLDLWSATLLKHDEGAPFEDAKDLYDTIDSIPLGDVAWETFSITYNGERPQRGDVPDWMNAKFDVWFRDPRTLIHNLISNPDFDGEFDYAPFHEYDKAGNHRFCDFMSGDWAWKQAVSLFIIIFNHLLDIIKDLIAEDTNTHGSMFVPIILGSDKTTVSVATGNNEYWPVYGSIGNIHNNVRRAHRNGVVLLGFLVIPKSMA